MFLCSLILTTIACQIYNTHGIPNGFLAGDAKFGFMVAIYDQRKYVCGGTIVSIHFVVTAAHCFQRGRDVNNIEVIFNTLDLTEITEENKRRLKDIIIHPRYSPITRDFDIAVLRLNKELKLQHPNVQTLDLAVDYDVYYGDTVTAIGWGLETEHNDVAPVKLTYTGVLVWERGTCHSRKIWGPDYHSFLGPLVSERMLCVNVPDIGPGTCYNDDGSPLVANGPTFLGILSWRYDCKSIVKPSVYISIPLMRSWLKRVMDNYDQ